MCTEEHTFLLQRSTSVSGGFVSVKSMQLILPVIGAVVLLVTI